jgi:carboxymethylenebutenolidase
MTSANHDEPSTVSRREFLVTALAVGFAAAVRPTAAEAVITTDAEGLTAGEVKVPAAGGDMPAYRALPAKGGPHPVVLVVEEVFGVHEHIKDVCRRFAKAGYLAIAPELFARQGDPTKITDVRRIIDDIVAKTPDREVLADLDATVAWAEKNGGDTSRLAITGFCWGGRIVWLYAAHSPKLKAGVAWYGRIDGERNDLQPKYPIDVARDLQAPVLGLYGGADDSISADQIERMKAALARPGGGSKIDSEKSEIVVYPNAPHGFHADYRPTYREQDARDGWKRLLAWFSDHGARP